MKLIIGNSEFAIKQFHFSINMGENHGEDIEIISDGSNDVSGLAQAISSAYEGSIMIQSGKREYTFTGFTFDSVNVNVTEDEERVNIRFRKEIADE